MKDKETGVFDQIEGLMPVDQNALEDFKREMTENVIPEIVQVMEERQMLAAESRHRELEVLIAQNLKRDK
jgi:hypothetical protein